MREVLAEIEADAIPELLVVNKADVFTEGQRKRIANLYPDAILVSALAGEGLDEIVTAISSSLAEGLVTLSLSIPYERGDLVAAAHEMGEVVEEKHDEKGTIIDVRLPAAVAPRFDGYWR